MGKLRRGVREVGLALITAGVVILLFIVYQLWGTNFAEQSHQENLARQFQAATAARPAATRSDPPASGAHGAPPANPPVATAATPDILPSVPPGGAIDHLVIPSIGVNKYVVEGTDENDLREGPGHYSGTAYPGQDGNTAIAGHRTTYGAPFFDLNQLGPGDKIYITDLNDRTWVYVVDQAPVVVDPNDVSVLDPTPFAQLTLTTCNPRFSATSRLVVYARLQGRAGPVEAPPAPKALPSVLPGDRPPLSAENLGRGQSGALGPAAAYGALAVVLWVLTRLAINRTRRWWRLLAYVAGIGICLGALWLCFENVVLLLPQSI